MSAWRYAADDSVRCTLPVVEWDYQADVLMPQPSRPCDGELYVQWSFMTPVVPGCPASRVNAPRDAVSSSWEVVCTNGHTVAVSANCFSATDDAESFDPNLVLVAAAGSTNGGSLEFSDGTVRTMDEHARAIASAAALMDGPCVVSMPPSADDIAELRGHDLACWCALDAPCHADVLLEIANASGTERDPQ